METLKGRGRIMQHKASSVETRPAAAEAAPMTPLLYPSLSASSPPPYQGTTFEQPHSNYIEATKNPRKRKKMYNWLKQHEISKQTRKDRRSKKKNHLMSVGM